MSENSQDSDVNQPKLTPFQQPLVQLPSEEFRLFSESRIEGLELTEADESIEAYRQAMALGLRTLNSEDESPENEDVS